jgi:hypothetical protein
MLFDIDPSSASSPNGKDEMNFAEFPIALLTDRPPKEQTVLEFEDRIYDPRRKRIIRQRRIIEGSKKYGLPTSTDDAVILALIQLTKLRGDFKKREVEFTRLELIRMLGWADEGRSYERVKTSLLRIESINYIYDNAWWDGRQKAWTSKAFHIIDTVEINDSRAYSDQGGQFPSRIVWNEVVFDSFRAGFLRDIDFQLCMSLQHPTSLRMYRFLGKRFYTDPDLTFDLKEFAYKHIGVSGNYEGGTQIARKLRPAVEELEKVGFLEPLPDRERFPKNGRKWSIRLIHKVSASAAPTPTATEAPSPAVAALVDRGVTIAAATELVRKHGEEAVQAQVEYLDWIREKRPEKVKDPAAYLVEAIKHAYAAPKGFVSKAEKQRRQEAKQAKERATAEARRRRQDDQQREQAERQALDAYWKSLTPKQQAELDAASRAAADPGLLKLETGPMKRYGQLLRRQAYIRQLLQNTPASTQEQKCLFDH